MNRIFLYGLGSAEKQYVCIRYSLMDEEKLSIKDLVREANYMRLRNPSIEHIYAVDDRRGLRRDYMESIKQHTIESCALFKDILEREGIQVI